jgi:hypothetical protein
VVVPAGLDFPEELLHAAYDPTGTLVWPGGGDFLFNDLISLSYPMIFREDQQKIIIGLNSCNSIAGSLFTSGYGYLEDDQLARLVEIVHRVPAKVVILLIHHHVGFPSGIMRSVLKHHTALQIKALQLKNSQSLMSILEAHNEQVIVFHGHKHIGYNAIRNNVTVISGPSIAYGDLLGRVGNCRIYDIDPSGKISILDELLPDIT